MPSMPAPVVELPLPTSPVPFEPAPELTVDAGELRFKEKMTITSLEELPVTWDS
jgi:hypothetical protein